jgi:hypothetical protein
MASLSAYYPLPVVAGTTAGTYAEGDKVAQLGAGSVVTSTGSTTARSLANRFGEVFHVDDYGAKGDWNGTTGTDDTVAINATIAAAIANGGGTIRFRPNAKYYIATRTPTPSLGMQFYLLGFFNGTTTTNLCFEGNRATLYAPDFPTGNSLMLFFESDFEKIIIKDLIFQRAPHVISQSTNRGTTAIQARPDLVNPKRSKLLGVYNCEFIDTRLAISTGPASTLRYLALLDLFECLDCKFLFPRGSSYGGWSDPQAGGNQTVNNSKWVNYCVYQNIYFDGCYGGIVPADVEFPVDGFHYVTAVHTKFKNCYFTNYAIEGVINVEGDCQHDIKFAQFTQPAVGSTVTITVVSNFRTDERLTVGRTYLISGSVTVGFFILQSFTGSFAGQVGQTCTFLRVSEASVNASPRFVPVADGALTPNLVNPIDIDLARECTFVVDGCTFDQRNQVEFTPVNITANASTNTFSCAANSLQIREGRQCVFKKLTGGSNVALNQKYFIRNVSPDRSTFQISTYSNNAIHSIGSNIASGQITSLGGHQSPCISNQNGSLLAINNSFLGTMVAIDNKDNFLFGPAKPVLIANNVFYLFSPYQSAFRQDQTQIVLNTSIDGTQFKNNQMYFKSSRDVFYAIFVTGNDNTISDNSMIVEDAITIGSGSDQVPNGTWFINGNNGAPTGGWKNYLKNNHFKNVNYYANAGDGMTVSNYTGSLLTALGVPFSGPIKLISDVFRSPDASEWQITITNNGEIEVTK